MNGHEQVAMGEETRFINMTGGTSKARNRREFNNTVERLSN
jgi:hypothetical protein